GQVAGQKIEYAFVAINEHRPIDELPQAILNSIDPIKSLDTNVQLRLSRISFAQDEFVVLGLGGLLLAFAFGLLDFDKNGAGWFVEAICLGVALINHILIAGLDAGELV